MDALAGTCIEYFRHHQDLVHDRDIVKSNRELFDAPERRRPLAAKIVELSPDPHTLFKLTGLPPRLIRDEDFSWCIKQLLASVGEPPLAPKELLELATKPASVLIRNANELQALILDSLTTLEKQLQGETPQAFALWDQTDRTRGQEKFRPKDENHLSDWIKGNLGTQIQSRGVVVAREVEIRRGEGSGIGERTDIHVTAVVPGLDAVSTEIIRVIIETKGCWNPELKTAMHMQLVDRYLKDNQCRHGIYLVPFQAR